MDRPFLLAPKGAIVNGPSKMRGNRTKVGLYEKDRGRNRVVRRLAGSINSSMAYGLHLRQQVTDQFKNGIRVHWFLDKSIRGG
jgi:hypothetical protein